MKLTKQQKLLALEADLKLNETTGYFFILLLGVAGLAGLIWIFEANRVW